MQNAREMVKIAADSILTNSIDAAITKTTNEISDLFNTVSMAAYVSRKSQFSEAYRPTVQALIINLVC